MYINTVPVTGPACCYSRMTLATSSNTQYVGSVLTVWGMTVLLWSQAPSGLGWLAAYWTALYIITGWQESQC